MSKEYYDIEYCFVFEDKKKENLYFKATGEDKGLDGIKEIARDIIKKRNLDGIKRIMVTDYNDYDDNQECYNEFYLQI